MPDVMWADNAAVAIGERLVADVVADDSTATWWTNELVKGASPPRTEPQLAGGSLYAGTAGIALFLAELGAVTGRRDFQDLARVALAHAMTHGPVLPARVYGLHAGMAGVLFAAAAYLRHWPDAELRRRSEDLLRTISSAEKNGSRLDVIGGEAGTILGLLAVTDVFDAQAIDAICAPLGWRLIRAANAEPWGISWPGGSPRLANLCGMAHGAAGIGLALLELHARTGRELFRAAGEEAFAYEAHWFDAAEGNWADLRNGPLDRYRSENRLGELDVLVRSGGPLALSGKTYMTAWCHGAPGIALARARAFDLLGSERYRDEALAALPLIRRSLDWTDAGHSLCHGFMGNAQCLLRIADLLKMPEVTSWTLRRIEEVASAVMSGRDRWRSGRLNQVPDPVLMVGEAGIGLALLGLTRPVPSVVLPKCVARRPPRPVRDPLFLRVKIATGCFPHTSAAMGAQRLKKVLLEEEGLGTPCMDELERRLAAAAAQDDSLSDAFWADSVMLKRAREEPFDRGFGFLSKVLPRSTRASGSLVLSPWVRLEQRSERCWLLYADADGRWIIRPLDPGVASLVELFHTPRTVTEATDAMARMSGESANDLHEWVEEQVRACLDAGILMSAVLSTAIRRSAAGGPEPERADDWSPSRSGPTRNREVSVPK